MGQITLGSLFDGIGGWQLAAIRNGVKPVWSSEIEPFPIAVTKVHFPFTRQLGDISKIKAGDIEPVDIICAGSPCQDLSIAGKRAGLGDRGNDYTTRSGLFRAAIDIVHGMRERTNGKYPSFFVWENVPGAFSTNKGRDFKAVLEEIGQNSISIPGSDKWAAAGMVKFPTCRIEWRILDAQYWGVPQRRRRIFLVADFTTSGSSSSEILFECQSLQRNPETSERSKEGASSGATGSAHQTGVTLCFSTQASIKDSNPILEECAPTMRGSVRLGVLSTKDMVFENHGRDARIKGPLTKGPAITAYAGTGGNNLPFVSHCLIVNQGGGQNYGKGEGGTTEATCYANSSYSTWEKSNICATQRAIGGILGGGSETLVQVKAIDCRNFRETITSGTLQSKASGGYSLNFQNPIRLGSIVRRMTPLECERIQGLPDGWTLIKDKTCSDSARYTALGNGMAQPCADWIIKRIVEAMQNSKG